MQNVEICAAEPSSAKPDGSVSETGGSVFSRSSDNLDETMMTKPDDREPWSYC
jgi:hypothetical protein